MGVKQRDEKERDTDRERQGVGGSRWVSTPAVATSTLGQLMFTELTGTTPTTLVPGPSPSLLPLEFELG